MGSLVQTKTITKLCNPILHFSDWKSMPPEERGFPPRRYKQRIWPDLVSVAHHGNEQVDEHDGSQQEVKPKHQFEKVDGPFLNVVGKLQITRFG